MATVKVIIEKHEGVVTVIHAPPNVEVIVVDLDELEYTITPHTIAEIFASKDAAAWWRSQTFSQKGTFVFNLIKKVTTALVVKAGSLDALVEKLAMEAYSERV